MVVCVCVGGCFLFYTVFGLADNPEYASQAGDHRYAHLLQDLSPAAFEKRRMHNVAMLKDANELVAELNGAGAAETPVHLVLFMQSIQDELTAFELGCHLYPVNSIGYGGGQRSPSRCRLNDLNTERAWHIRICMLSRAQSMNACEARD